MNLTKGIDYLNIYTYFFKRKKLALEGLFLDNLHSNLPIINEIIRKGSHASANKRSFWLFVKER
jgi:hypothetical protein